MVRKILTAAIITAALATAACNTGSRCGHRREFGRQRRRQRNLIVRRPVFSGRKRLPDADCHRPQACQLDAREWACRRRQAARGRSKANACGTHIYSRSDPRPDTNRSTAR